MAGIGFELKKLFSKKGLILNIRANFYATLVVAGPMILGAVLLFGMKYMSSLAGAPSKDQDVLVVIITYSILFPLLLTSMVSFVLTRFVADKLYENQYEHILPSMYGAISLCLLIGSVSWGIFLYFSQTPIEYCILSFFLFNEAIAVWIEMAYISAAKDYMSILRSFGLGVILGLLAGYLFIWNLHFNIIISLLAAACISYGTMLVGFTITLHNYFPIGNGTSLMFLEWIEKYPILIWVGLFTMLGLFTHLLLMWGSPWGKQAIGLFYHAPAHDIPALVAFLTTLVTTVNFVTSVEVNFYPKYRTYFSLLNEGGSLIDIEKAYKEMITTLKQELFYLAQVQMFVEVIVIAVAGAIIPGLGMGFNTVMIGLFRVLCVGYGLFAIGNSIVLFLLYFSDNKGALLVTSTLFVVNVIGTLFTFTLPQYYYGFGFLVASLCMYIVGWIRLSLYIRHLDYNIFCKQPIFLAEKHGWLTRIARRLDA